MSSIRVEEDILDVLGYIQTDKIIENSSNNGVIIEDILLKDGNISIGLGTSSYTFPSEIGLSGQTMILNTSGSLVFETSTGSTNSVIAPLVFNNDNRIIKSFGIGREVEETGLIISDTNDLSGINQLTLGSGTSGYIFPTEIGLESQVLSVSSDGGLIFTTISGGNLNSVLAPSEFGTDNRLLKSLGTGRNVESTGVIISDNDDISGINSLISDTVIITGNDQSSGSSSGALIVQGGLGVGGTINTETLNVIQNTELNNLYTTTTTVNGTLLVTEETNIRGRFTLNSGTSGYTFPTEVGTENQVLSLNTEGGLIFTTPENGGNPTSVLAPSTFGTDNRMLRTSGIDRDIEVTGIEISDTDDISGINDFAAINSTLTGTLSVFGISSLTNLIVGTGTSSYSMPGETGLENQILSVNPSGDLVFTTPTIKENIVTSTNEFGTDNRLTKTSGIGKEIEATGITISDTDNISGINDLNAVNTTLSGTLRVYNNLTLGTGTSSYSLPSETGLENQILSVNPSGDLVFIDTTNNVTATNDFGTDNRLTKTVGVGKEIEATGISISDTDDISGVNDLIVNNQLNVKNILTLGIGTSSYDFPMETGVTDQVLSISSTGGLLFRTPVTFQEISSTITVSTTSLVYVLLNGMTITPGKGEYCVTFSSVGRNNVKNKLMEYSFHKDGIEIITSRRSFGDKQSKNVKNSMFTQTVISLNGTETLDIRYRVSGGTFTVFERNMILVKK